MKRAAWQLPLALVLFSSAVPLAQVWLDRQAGVRGTMTVSERELHRWYTADENSGEQLQWSWWSAPELDSVPHDQLAGLGVSCRRDRYNCGTRGQVRGWVVLGIATNLWQREVDSLRARGLALEARRATEPDADSALVYEQRQVEGQLDQVRYHRSRLTMVAVGTDAEALMRQWNDGEHLIVAARIRVYRSNYGTDSMPGFQPLYRIHAEPLPPNLYVPLEFIPLVRDTVGRDEPQYDVTVEVGGRWLPRIIAVSPATGREVDPFHRR